MISQWRGQGFEGRVHGYISWTGKKADTLGVTWPDRIKEWFVDGWHKFYTAMKDQGHYLDLMVRDAARRGYKADVGDDAYRQIAKPVETLAGGKPLQPADIPGLSGFALRQDYSESTQEFYDRKDQIEKQYNSAKDDGNVTPALDVDYHRLQDYADLMSQMRMAVKDVADRDKRFEVEKYIVGLARASLGKEELNRYPNPMLAQDAPQVVRTACDKYLGTKLYQLTSPVAKRELGEAAENYQQRRQRHEVTVERARQILDDLDIPLVRMRVVLQKEAKSRGLKTQALSGDHPSAYAERLSRLRKGRLAAR